MGEEGKEEKAKIIVDNKRKDLGMQCQLEEHLKMMVINVTTISAFLDKWKFGTFQFVL